MYAYEQIANKSYLKVSGILLDLCKDEKSLNQMKEILFNGKINGKLINTDESNKDNPEIEGRRRISMSYLLLTNPKTFEYFVNNNINLFHGTRASNIPSIIKYGLTSVNKSKENNVNVTTGETWSRINGSRSFVSLTDVLDVAFDYSTIGSSEELNYEAIVLTSTDMIKKLPRKIVKSETPEIGIENEIPKDCIKAICVPSDRVSFYKKIVADEIDILPLDHINNRFYYVDDGDYPFINDKALEAFKNGLSKDQKRFKINDFINILKEVINKKLGKEDSYDRTR